MEKENLLQLRLNVQRFVRLFGSMERNVTPCGFPLSISQVMTLQELEHHKLTLMALSEKLMLERSSVSRLVDQLVTEGFLLRETNADNRREVLLSLAEKGTRALHNVREQSVAFYERILLGMAEADRIKIWESFQLFNDALANERGVSDGPN